MRSPSDRAAALEALRRDPALADTGDPAVRWVLRLLEGGERAAGVPESAVPLEPSGPRRAARKKQGSARTRP
jgi:hypothetical protein